MRKIQISKYLLSTLICLLLSGCARGFLAEQSELDQQEAIDTAVKIAAMSIPEFGGSQVEPTNIRAEKMTLEQAAKRFGENPQNAFSKASPDTQVWLVSMDGVWQGAEAPGVATKPYQHLSIILDAKTGLEIYRNAEE